MKWCSEECRAFWATVAITIALFVMAWASKFDVRGCTADTSVLDAARGAVICPPPQTTMYGQNAKAKL